MNYYNDFETGNWLKELIKAGLIPEGEVDDRSITDIEPQDLNGFRQCHFFAGIGGWPRALELAGWNPDEFVWSASLPCQPLSCAGQQRGHEDERHLWPIFFNLVKECRPPVIFGEQVASKDGREWLSGIQTDLETLGYISAAADLPAASVGSPHKRNRLFWVATLAHPELHGQKNKHEVSIWWQPGEGCGVVDTCEKCKEYFSKYQCSANLYGECDCPKCQGLCECESSPTGRVADSANQRTGRPGQTKQGGNRQENRVLRQNGGKSANFWSNSIAIPCADGKWRRVPGRMADDISQRRYATKSITGTLERCNGKSITQNASRRLQGDEQNQLEIEPDVQLMVARLRDRMGDSWHDGIIEALNCFPLSESIPGKVGMLKGAGNSIVAPVAAEFIKAVMEIT